MTKPRLVAIAIYAYARDGELRALGWEDVDLEHATVHIDRAWDRKGKSIKATKGAEAKRVPIEPNLLPLLQAMLSFVRASTSTGTAQKPRYVEWPRLRPVHEGTVHHALVGHRAE